MGMYRNVSMLLKRSIEKSIAYVIGKGQQEKKMRFWLLPLATAKPEMRETFQMAIQELLAVSIRGALCDPSRAIDTAENAAEDNDVVDGRFKK
jgi:hypothetical protein